MSHDVQQDQKQKYNEFHALLCVDRNICDSSVKKVLLYNCKSMEAFVKTQMEVCNDVDSKCKHSAKKIAPDAAAYVLLKRRVRSAFFAFLQFMYSHPAADNNNPNAPNN